MPRRPTDGAQVRATQVLKRRERAALQDATMDDTQAAFYATAQCTPDRSSTASFAHALITPARSLSHAEQHCHTNHPPSTAQARKPTHAHTRETACAHATESKACGEKDQVYQAPPRGSSTADAHASIACLFPPHPTPRPRPFEGRSAIAAVPQLGRGWAWSLFEGVGEEDRDQVGIDLVKEHEAARLAEDTPRSTRPQARHASLANDRLDAL